jgi:NAD(P)-dependent dehydrogenase (short-subunit alcohol dehydrogenase family)
LVVSTPGIVQQLAPELWAAHRFGLPQERWERLARRTFWITGAGTGFGQAIAVALAAAGARVYASGRRRERLEHTASEADRLANASARVISLPLDILDSDAVARVSDAIVAAEGAINGVVNSAALPSPPIGPWPLADCRPEQWRRLFETNVTGQFLVTQAALRTFAPGSSMRVVFLTSEAGWASTPGVGPYNVSKAAVNALGASFAAEYAERYPDADIRINVLIPGEARTEMNQGSIDSPYTVVPMCLALLSHPAPGPTGSFFHRDGRHFSFAYASAYGSSLL